MQFDLEVVLSLFDGAGMGQEALKRAGLTYRVYLASEIDKPAMRVAMRNHPQTIQIGDITQIQSEFLPQKINLLMAGSPCQGFSFANTSTKKLAFDHPQSKLFFEFIRILDETKPDFVFLENVRMKTEWRDMITDMISEVRGYRIEPVLWDSSWVSGQKRIRNYWTDIPGFVIPEDRGILLKDILEDGDVETDKAATIKASYYKSSKANFERTDGFHATGVITNLPETKDASKYSPVKGKNYVQFDKSGKGFKSQQDRYFYRNNKAGTIGTKGHANIEVKGD